MKLSLRRFHIALVLHVLFVCIYVSAINTYITRKHKTSIDASIIVAAFQKCGISNTIDSSEDHLIREEIPMDVDDDNNLDPKQDIEELDYFTDSDD